MFFQPFVPVWSVQSMERNIIVMDENMDIVTGDQGLVFVIWGIKAWIA